MREPFVLQAPGSRPVAITVSGMHHFAPAPVSEPVRKAAPALRQGRHDRPVQTPLKGAKRPIKSTRDGSVEPLFGSRSLPDADSMVETPEAIATAS